MVTKRPLPSRDVLHSELFYDPDTGLLWWKSVRNGRIMNKPAGTPCKKGYTVIGINRRPYKAHNLIWKMVYGEDPPADKTVDHINRIRDDNRLVNLRLATDHEQSMNRKERPNSRGALRCVNKQDIYWRLRIVRNGKPIDRRVFKCLGRALKARNEFERAEAA